MEIAVKEKPQLVRLTPDQAERLWETFLRDMFSRAIGDIIDPVAQVNTRLAIVLGRATCWVLKSYTGYKTVVLTTEEHNQVLGTRHLFVHALTSLGMSREEWQIVTETLVSYSSDKGLHSILFQTEVASVANYVRSLGGRVSNLVELGV